MFNEHSQTNNIVLHQIINNNDSISIKEIKPIVIDSSFNKFLKLTPTNNLILESFEITSGPQIKLDISNGILTLDASVDTSLLYNDKIKETNIYYKDDRIGIGRSPLHSYKLDICLPENTLMTALHIGDGKCGFSMGNGTSNGFLPEIIGIGSDENDAGLYFLGKACNDISSNIPIIILDSRNLFNDKIRNRPLFAVTNANYNDYDLLLDQRSNLTIKGYIYTSDLIIDNSVSVLNLIKIINEQKKQIDILNTRLTNLENIK